ASTVAAEVAGNNRLVVCRVQRIDALVPVVAAERSAGQIHLHDVVELAIAREGFDFAVVQDIVGNADAGSDLFAEAEDQIREALRVVGRQVFLREADAEIQRQSMTNLPCVLNVELMSVLCGRTGVGYGLTTNHEVPITALTGVRRTAEL